MTNKITDILGYEFTRNGGSIILKFSNNWITKRTFKNVLIEHNAKKCALSGKVIPVGNTAIFVAIKKQGFTRYFLSQEAVNNALSGEYHETVDSSSDIVKSLLGFITDCEKERKEMIKDDVELRAALASIKFKKSKLSRKMTTAHQLLELVSKDNK